MASSDDQQQAARRLKIHRRNLARLEETKAKLAGEVNLAVDNQIDEEKANIAALEPIANPPPLPSPKVQEFIKATVPQDIDNAMLFIQGIQANARLTKVEEWITKVEEKVETIVQAQGAAQLWRLDIADRLENSDAQRVYGQKRNFRLSVASLVLLFVLALALWFILARAGVV